MVWPHVKRDLAQSQTEQEKERERESLIEFVFSTSLIDVDFSFCLSRKVFNTRCKTDK